MAGPIVRILVQAIVYGARFASNAFVQAYQNVAANPAAAKQAAADAAKKASFKKVMQKDEALKILNFERVPDKQELMERYTKYFEANDPKKGGSFYIQSKFVRAKEVVEEQLKEETAKKEKGAEE